MMTDQQFKIITTQLKGILEAMLISELRNADRFSKLEKILKHDTHRKIKQDKAIQKSSKGRQRRNP